MSYLTLFFTSFLAATLLPLGSEALLLYHISQDHAPFLLWLSATIGNTLGSTLNYWVGLKGEGYLRTKGYLSKKRLENYRKKFDNYGGWSLLFSWIPVIGDPLTLIAGMLHYNFRYFVSIVFLAKGLRYATVIFLASSLSV